MIELLRPEKSATADRIEETFRSLSLAYRCRVSPGRSEESLPTSILDGGERIEGEQAIQTWLRTLELELRIQRSVSGDGCYVDPSTGETC